MKIVQWTGYGCFGLAGLSVILAMANEAPGFLGAGVCVLILGVGFLAAHRALLLLGEIRDALVPRPTQISAGATLGEDSAPVSESMRTRTIAEISAEISAMKARV